MTDEELHALAERTAQKAHDYKAYLSAPVVPTLTEGLLAQGYLALSDRLAALEADLGKWRGWAQFVFNGGGPVSGTDDELRTIVCARYDADIEAVKSERGEIVKACPQCNSQMICLTCWQRFNDPAYWQRRVAKP